MEGEEGQVEGQQVLHFLGKSILSTYVQTSPINCRTLEDGEGEFDPLLDDEDDDEENMGRRNSRPGVQGGYNLLYIGSLKVSLFPQLEIIDRIQSNPLNSSAVLSTKK